MERGAFQGVRSVVNGAGLWLCRSQSIMSGTSSFDSGQASSFRSCRSRSIATAPSSQFTGDSGGGTLDSGATSGRRSRRHRELDSLGEADGVGLRPPQQTGNPSKQCTSYIRNDGQLCPVRPCLSSYLMAQAALPYIVFCVVQMLLLTACSGAGCVIGAAPPHGVLQLTRMMGGKAKFVSPSAPCCSSQSMPLSACLTTWSGLSAAKLHHQESLIGQDSVGQRHLRSRTIMTPTTDQVRSLMCCDVPALLVVYQHQAEALGAGCGCGCQP